MEKVTSIFLILTIGCGVCLSESTILPCRYSGDFTSFYIYLSQHVAITKSTSKQLDGDYETFFRIGKAHFLNEPELANNTGDVMDEDIVSTPKRIGVSEGRDWLLVTGQNTDTRGQVSNHHVWLISLSTEKIYPAHDMAALELQLKTNQIILPPIETEPVQVFFDRELISHLSQKKFSLARPIRNPSHISEAISSDGKVTEFYPHHKPVVTNSFGHQP